MAFANKIELAEVFQEALDEQVYEESKTAWMDENAGRIKYNGGKTVKVPKMSTTGLGDYSRNNGYPQGSINVEYETLDMTQDRGASFTLDSMDVDETNFAANATDAMMEFQRDAVVPEVDAYRISALATYAIEGGYEDHVHYGYTPNAESIKAELAWACEVAGDDAVILATPATVAALETAVGSVNLEAAEFTTFGYDQRVVAFNGRPIIKVDPSRMYTAIKTLTLENGEGGGWMPADDAKKINFIAVARYAPIGVNKVDRPKIFEPEENQTHDGWKLTYRRYHDLWVMENKRKMIAVSLAEREDSGSEIVSMSCEPPELSFTATTGGTENFTVKGVDKDRIEQTFVSDEWQVESSAPETIAVEYVKNLDETTGQYKVTAKAGLEAGAYTITVTHLPTRVSGEVKVYITEG